MDDQELITHMMKSYLNFSRKDYKKGPLYQLNDLSVKFAQYLCLTNYEVVEWQRKYLKIWYKCPIEPYIHCSDFLKAMHCKYTPLIRVFCEGFEQRFTPDNIITFISIFVFTELDELIRILFSVCAYQSNLSLSIEQTTQFFKTLNEFYYLDPVLNGWLDEHNEDNLIQIQEIIKIVRKCSTLTTHLNILKHCLIYNFITLKSYNEIVKRINYYNDIYVNNHQHSRSPPNEGCISKAVRFLFTQKPQPYYSDYRTASMNYKLIQSTAIFEVRSQFGYSQRPVKMSAKQMSLYSLSSLNKKMKSSSSQSMNKNSNSNKLICSSTYDLQSLCSVNYTSSSPSPNLIRPFRKIIEDCNNINRSDINSENKNKSKPTSPFVNGSFEINNSLPNSSREVKS